MTDENPTAITRAEVEHVAGLARLGLSADEVDRLTHELAGILIHARDMGELDLSGVEPTSHPLPLVNVVRPDEISPSLDRDEVLAAAPAVQDNQFRVPRILEAP
ncbi:glutamyl-tRNA(Gln) amidotransferase subunit C [Actinomycetes bacterium]|nr:glutamyl-tRNA(Gln) amidotransferase subunit C [Actinomycetes bacterium]